VALGLLASCDDAVPSDPAPCASATGDEWEFLGLQDDTLGYVRAVAIDPADPARILAGTTSDATGGLLGHLFLSEDDGVSWQQVLESPRSFIDVVFDSSNPATVYAATLLGVYRSVDGGLTWIYSSPDICIDPETGLTFLRRSSDGLLYAGTAGNLGGCPFTMYRSEDEAQTWEDLCKGQSGCLPNGPFTLAIDPSDPQRLLAGLKRTFGMQESTNGGDTWTTNGYDQAGYAAGIAVDVDDSETIYVGHSMGGASRSTDGGEVWMTFDTGLQEDAVGDNIVQDAQTGTLYLLASFDTAGVLWRRETGSDSWKLFGIAGEDLRVEGALSVTEDQILYVGSYGLWRRDLTVIPANEPGPCGPKA